MIVHLSINFYSSSKLFFLQIPQWKPRQQFSSRNWRSRKFSRWWRWWSL